MSGLVSDAEQNPAARRGFAILDQADPSRVYLSPCGIVSGDLAVSAVASGTAMPTGRPGEAATGLRIMGRNAASDTVSSFVLVSEFLLRIRAAKADPATERLAAFAEALGKPRGTWAGLSFDRPLVMGVLNVTPDSFSDGGQYASAGEAVEAGLGMIKAGADLLDVGGESTRPGAPPISIEDERARVLPVVAALAGAGAIVSVDTRHPAVMASVLDAGARIINDVEALRAPGAIGAGYRPGTGLVLMHMRGEPRTMQADPRYDDPVLDVFEFLEARIAACASAGIPREAIVIDPGIGFGKTEAHNLAILASLGLYRTLGCGLLVGVSRKRFIGQLSGVERPADRVAGSLAAGLASVARGADILRVHDVAATVQALRVVTALERPGF